jgi:pimeloyl-ACP methyl ester carboxylesterase
MVIGGAYPELTETSQVWVASILGDAHSAEVDIAAFERKDPGFAAMLQENHGDNWKTLLRQIKPMWNARLNYTPADFAVVVAPTLVLLGDRDGFVTVEEGLKLFRLLPRAEFAVVPGSEHPDFIFSPPKIALIQPILLDFLRRSSSSSA